MSIRGLLTLKVIDFCEFDFSRELHLLAILLVPREDIGWLLAELPKVKSDGWFILGDGATSALKDCIIGKLLLIF